MCFCLPMTWTLPRGRYHDSSPPDVDLFFPFLSTLLHEQRVMIFFSAFSCVLICTKKRGFLDPGANKSNLICSYIYPHNNKSERKEFPLEVNVTVKHNSKILNSSNKNELTYLLASGMASGVTTFGAVPSNICGASLVLLLGGEVALIVLPPLIKVTESDTVTQHYIKFNARISFTFYFNCLDYANCILQMEI